MRFVKVYYSSELAARLGNSWIPLFFLSEFFSVVQSFVYKYGDHTK